MIKDHTGNENFTTLINMVTTHYMGFTTKQKEAIKDGAAAILFREATLERHKTDREQNEDVKPTP